MDRSTLGHVLRPLERRGLERLHVSEQDGRSRVAKLTLAGRALVTRGRPLWARAQQRFASAFGEKGALDLRTALRRERWSTSVRVRRQTTGADEAEGP